MYPSSLAGDGMPVEDDDGTAVFMTRKRGEYLFVKQPCHRRQRERYLDLYDVMNVDIERLEILMILFFS